MSVPIKWDPADGPCPHCVELRDRKFVPDPATSRERARACDGCGCVIPVLPGMNGAGFESASVHHFHLDASGGRVLWVPAMRELCAACFRADYFAVFPDSKLDPVTSLPRAG